MLSSRQIISITYWTLLLSFLNTKLHYIYHFLRIHRSIWQILSTTSINYHATLVLKNTSAILRETFGLPLERAWVSPFVSRLLKAFELPSNSKSPAHDTTCRKLQDREGIKSNGASLGLANARASKCIKRTFPLERQQRNVSRSRTSDIQWAIRISLMHALRQNAR